MVARDIHRRSGNSKDKQNQLKLDMARAGVSEPKVLLADEPISGLSPQTLKATTDLLHQVHEETGKKVVIVTHEKKS